tara:strand:+ start:66 stop:389 length:324 start_codon:yes stop_codon:yes gene_type:complete
MSTKDTKAEWEAVLESLTNESKKRKTNNGIMNWLRSVTGGLAGIGLLSFISGFLLMRLNHHANQAWDFVPAGAGYWDCFNVMVFVWLIYMLKLAIQNSFNNTKGENQ